MDEFTGSKRPSGWHNQQTSCQSAASIRFLMDVGESELAMKMDIIFVVGCAELSPADGGRHLSLQFHMGHAEISNSSHAKLVLSVLQICKTFEVWAFRKWRQRRK